jgi:predicted NBD/HSP70 family sugar kinase
LKYFAVFDVGGSSIKYALMNEIGGFLEKGSVLTPKYSVNVFLETINMIVENYRRLQNLAGIAISMPGIVDITTGFIDGESAVPYIHGPNIKQLLQEKTGLRVELENDGHCAGFAEGWLGAAKDSKDYVCIVLGSGIGGAVFLDKKLRRGINHYSGEFGYMLIEGNQNWGTLVSTSGLVRQVANRKRRDVSSLDGKKIFQMADNGDRKAKEEIERFVKHLAVGIFNIQYILDTEKILIGGAISERYDLISQINEKLQSMKERLNISVERCKFGNDSNLIGALYHFLQQNN